MKLNYIYILFLISLCFSCANETAKNKDYITDVKVESHKLSCDGIIMENHTGKINASEFSYGEKITLFYENMTGFTLKDSLAYPDMHIFVTNKKGDTIMSQENLFDNIKETYTEKDLNLRSKVTFASPMLANNSYVLHINISDKNSDAYYKLKKNFSMIENPLLKTKTDGLSYKILYLFSQTRNIAILDNKISPEESVYILLEDLDGYEIDADGKVDLSASISLRDADGKLINEISELFKEPVSAKDLKDQLYATLSITKGKISNPVTCVFKVKDKKTEKTFETSFELMVQ